MKFNKISLTSFLIEALIASRAFAMKKYRPIVIWHGMGDTCCNEQSIGGFMEGLKEMLPGVYVYSINVSDSTSELVERKNSYFGNINDQVDYVCNKLQDDDIYPFLKNGFNAIGFSQGGQFLRAYVERCNKPRVYNLITYGAQHNGVYSIPGCGNDDSDLCLRMRMLLSANVYNSFIQHHVIQAQYFKDIDNYEEYLEKSIFLADINNEREIKNSRYKDNMISLNKFVMIKFGEDQAVIPSTSPWFGWVNDFEELIPLNETIGYQEDWIGLQTLDKANKLEFLTTPGNHMQIDYEFFIEEVLHPYLDEPMETKPKDGEGEDEGEEDDQPDDEDDDYDDEKEDIDKDEDLERYERPEDKENKDRDEYLNSFFFKMQQ